MSKEVGENELALVQIGMNSNDLVASLRLYAQLFGFSNAGGIPAWGDNLQIQGLIPDSYLMMWWMVGARPFFQLELFNHGHPKQRPLRHDWRPADHGWVRFGIAIENFDRVVSGLKRLSIPVLGTSGAEPRRRLAFRDPQVGCIVEVIERSNVPGPEIIYAASSVADLEAARILYGKTLGLEICPLETLHRPEDESLWGMPGAKRDGFVVQLSGGRLEIIQYSDPLGRPRPADYRTSDQGIVNICIGTRTMSLIRDVINRVKADGRTTTSAYDVNNCYAVYSIDPGYEIEFVCVPRELDAVLGYAKSIPFVAEVDN